MSWLINTLPDLSLVDWERCLVADSPEESSTPLPAFSTEACAALDAFHPADPGSLRRAHVLTADLDAMAKRSPDEDSSPYHQEAGDHADSYAQLLRDTAATAQVAQPTNQLNRRTIHRSFSQTPLLTLSDSRSIGRQKRHSIRSMMIWGAAALIQSCTCGAHHLCPFLLTL